MAFQVVRAPTAFSLDKSGRQTASFKDEAHLAFIRKLPSVVSGNYPCEACHIRAGSAAWNKKRTGKAQRPSDPWCLPLTPQEHREQHSMNEMDFWRLHGIDPFAIAARLYEATGDVDAGRRIVFDARKHRNSPWAMQHDEDRAEGD